ncbi:Uncharacterised protein [Yersinia enterocolitica]|nr:Uncharacterised protein [Yersinia enterocolitica]VEF80721.1 Uncharacterised protein [Yersinia enterocolitica subsp. palearctica]CND43061.1 Uncharacterised protein [Yersinia enterocolitica]CNE01134.1 Uncharacterised protein [Yersinia enterocolitica]CNF60997.1 Uncharacterised protein [Yersinia enterocolitica]
MVMCEYHRCSVKLQTPNPKPQTPNNFTAANQGALSPAMHGLVFSPVRLSFFLLLPFNRFPAQPIPQG